MKQVYRLSSFVIFSLAGLSACSTINTVKSSKSTLNNLQQELTQHRYSSYVKSSLKPQQTPRATTSKYTPNTNNYRHALAIEKRKIQKRKTKSSARLKSTVIHNGLFTPNPEMRIKSRSSNRSLRKKAPLSAVLTLALSNNLDIKSRQKTALASLAKYDQVSYLDDILAQYSAFTKDISLSGSTQKHNKSVNTGFPFPSLLALKASIIDQSLEVSRLKIKQTTQDVITQTRIAYAELQYAQQEIRLTSANGKLLKSLKEELQNDYESNRSGLNEILQVDIERDENSNSIRIARNKQQAQQARINALLNLSADFKFAGLDALKPIIIKQNATQLATIAKRKRVEIAQLQAEVEKMQGIIRLSERRFYPDFHAGYSRFQNRATKQLGSNAKQATFSQRPKIKANAFFAKNDAYLTETKLKIKALQSKISALKTKTNDDIQQAYSLYQTQQNHHSLYQGKILPKAKTSLSIAKNNFEAGEGSLASIIDSQRMILNYRLLNYKAITGMNVQSARLKRIMGGQ